MFKVLKSTWIYAMVGLMFLAFGTFGTGCGQGSSGTSSTNVGQGINGQSENMVKSMLALGMVGAEDNGTDFGSLGDILNSLVFGDLGGCLSCDTGTFTCSFANCDFLGGGIFNGDLLSSDILGGTQFSLEDFGLTLGDLPLQGNGTMTATSGDSGGSLIDFNSLWTLLGRIQNCPNLPEIPTAGDLGTITAQDEPVPCETNEDCQDGFVCNTDNVCEDPLCQAIDVTGSIDFSQFGNIDGFLQLFDSQNGNIICNFDGETLQQLFIDPNLLDQICSQIPECFSDTDCGDGLVCDSGSCVTPS